MALPPKKKGGGKCKEIDFGNSCNFLGNLMVFLKVVKEVLKFSTYPPPKKKKEG